MVNKIKLDASNTWRETTTFDCLVPSLNRYFRALKLYKLKVRFNNFIIKYRAKGLLFLVAFTSLGGLRVKRCIKCTNIKTTVLVSKFQWERLVFVLSEF